MRSKTIRKMSNSRRYKIVAKRMNGRIADLVSELDRELGFESSKREVELFARALSKNSVDAFLDQKKYILSEESSRKLSKEELVEYIAERVKI